MDVQLDLLLDGVSVAVEAVVGGADVDAAVVATHGGVRDGQTADALLAGRHLAALLECKEQLVITGWSLWLDSCFGSNICMDLAVHCQVHPGTRNVR